MRNLFATGKNGLALACALAGAALLTGCASTYVDTATKEIPVASMKKPAQPVPVQVVFEFQTKGAPNARATDFLKEAVTAQILDTGLFSVPAPGAPAPASLLSVT